MFSFFSPSRKTENPRKGSWCNFIIRFNARSNDVPNVLKLQQRNLNIFIVFNFVTKFRVFQFDFKGHGISREFSALNNSRYIRACWDYLNRDVKLSRCKLSKELILIKKNFVQEIVLRASPGMKDNNKRRKAFNNICVAIVAALVAAIKRNIAMLAINIWEISINFSIRNLNFRLKPQHEASGSVTPTF